MTIWSIKETTHTLPLGKPFVDMEDPICVEEESDEPFLPILTIDKDISLKEPKEDTMYFNFL